MIFTAIVFLIVLVGYIAGRLAAPKLPLAVASSRTGGAGGSGAVILRYPSEQVGYITVGQGRGGGFAVTAGGGGGGSATSYTGGGGGGRAWSE